jgi:hypothetical protein
MSPDRLKKAKSAVIRVGDARGFVVKGPNDNPAIITASHCLRRLPKPWQSGRQEIYPNLIGPLGRKPSIWAKCLFVDPIADIAVLSSVDNQSLFEEADAYDNLIRPIKPIPIGPMEEKTKAWSLSLKGEWLECQAKFAKWADGPLFIYHATQAIRFGMSGSPVVADNGKAIGVVCAGTGDYDTYNPRLVRSLPGWLLGIHSLGGSLVTERKRKAARKAYMAEKLPEPKIQDLLP